jgi:hypothetical protein
MARVKRSYGPSKLSEGGFMKHRLRHSFLLFLGLVVIASTGAHGQQPVIAGYDQVAVAAPLSQGELDALLAPVALYPDELLAQMLMASTYPLEIVTAARFVQQNPSLTGDALDQALRDQNWDPSVLSLTAYPQVLLMMNDRLDWTQRLGDAFLANQQQVMDTVQTLRSRAQAVGNLQSTPQQTVMNQGGFIDIEPAQPQFVYVPVYDPRVIYGPWSDPVHQPNYWYPPPIYGYPDLSAGITTTLRIGRNTLTGGVMGSGRTRPSTAMVWRTETAALRTDIFGPILPRFRCAKRIAGVT